jgi:fructose-bisphosphate aldolase class I
MIPGIKVDKGAVPLAFSPDEKVTDGLDGLRERLQEYVQLGARFTKWRAVITIGDGIPTDYCLQVNAHALGRYAALSQEAGLVPIVEPEVLMDADNSIERCYDVTVETLHLVFDELHHQRVKLDEMLLKPNMVISGKGAAEQASAERVAELTLRAFHETVPAAVPGIVFLSGGQSDEQASENLNAINAHGPQPWKLSYSYGRALQAPALQAWRGEAANVEAGQQALVHRARLNSAAAGGRYTADMEELARAT